MSTPARELFTSRITGTGSAFPERVVTNADLCRILESREGEIPENFGPEWIVERTGIETRHFSNLDREEETCSGLALQAARRALEMAGRKASDIDGILFATCTPDTLLPSAACFLQMKLEATRAWAMDLNAACSGFQHALTTAHQFLASGNAGCILVVGADVLTSYTDFSDRKSCILFGDAAGAAIVERERLATGRGIVSSRMGADGNGWDLFHIPAGGSSRPLTPQGFMESEARMQMKGSEIFKTSIRTMVGFAEETLKLAGMKSEEIRLVVPHQANLRILEGVARRMGMPLDRFSLNISRRGNTSAATVPTALDEAVRAGRVQPGDAVLLNVFGAGLTYGSTLLHW